MTYKIIYFFVFIILQNILLIDFAHTKEQSIEIDSIVAIAETSTITRLELNKKKETIRKSFLQQDKTLPSNKEITKLAIDQLISEKLVIEFASKQNIFVTADRLNKVITNIASSNNLKLEELISEVESDGMSFANFREDIRKQLIIDQVKKRIISAEVRISDFEIDNFIELQKERTPDSYNFSHILIESIKNNEIVDQEKTDLKLQKILDQLKKDNFKEVAIIYSDGPRAKEGGLIGWKTSEDLPEIFIEPLEKMVIGSISPVINGSNGFHILKLNDKKEFEVEKVVIKQTKVMQILIKRNQITSEDEIQKKLAHIRNLIIEGMLFTEAAEKYSEDGSAANKGDLGWLNQGDTLPEFEKILDELDINKLSQPVKTPLGWHLIMVTDRRDQDMSTESLRSKVKNILLKQKIEIKFSEWVKLIREGAYVEIWLYED